LSTIAAVETSVHLHLVSGEYWMLTNKDISKERS